MKTVLIELHCPVCGAIFHKKSETLLLHGFESTYEQQLKNETFFTAHCPICGKNSKILHNFLYVDKEHHFALLVKSKKDMVEADQELYCNDKHLIKRYISNIEHIAEKMAMLEDGLDDRVIEIIKVKLRMRYQKMGEDKHIRYHDMDRKSRTVWFDIISKDNEDIIGLEWESYQRILESLDLPTHMFVEIDQA